MALVSSLVVVTVASAQAPSTGGRAAATITEADVRRRVYLIADDSMGGRDTPSKGLETTARYIAREFERFGLKPAGDGTSYFQRYGIRIRTIEPDRSTIAFSNDDQPGVTLTFSRDAKLLVGSPREAELTRGLVAGGGPIGPTTELDAGVIAGRALIWFADWRGSPPNFGSILIAAANAGASLVILSVDSDSAFGRLTANHTRSVTAEAVGWPPVVAIRESALGLAGEVAARVAELRGATQAAAGPAGAWSIALRLAFAEDDRIEVPNVVGIVPGTDPALAGEYLAISAHFDHVGSRCRGVTPADSICNGADDNGSGTTGLLELAEAFAHPDAKPRRSVLFVAVSGEERGLWGSEYFANHPTVPIDRIVANINMDHLGRNWRDSIVVIGREHSDLGATVDEVAGANPRLGVGVLPDQWPKERIYFRSDHYNFARNGVPILFFTNGFHPDYHAVTDTPDKIDAEKQARVVQLIFHTARTVANRTARPRWNPESERQIVKRRAATP